MQDETLEQITQEIRDIDSVAGFLWHETREGMAWVDQNGVMRIVNPAFASLLGYSSWFLEGKPFTDIVVSRDREMDAKDFVALVSGTKRSMEIDTEYSTRWDTILPAHVRAVKFKGGVLILGQVLKIDVFELSSLSDKQIRQVWAVSIGTIIVEFWSKLIMWVSSRWKHMLWGLVALTGLLQSGEIVKAMKLMFGDIPK